MERGSNQSEIEVFLSACTHHQLPFMHLTAKKECLAVIRKSVLGTSKVFRLDMSVTDLTGKNARTNFLLYYSFVTR